MSRFHIAVIAGDGVGPEVVEPAVRVAEVAVRREGHAIAWNRLPWSSTFYKETGRMIPDDGWDILRCHDAIFVGAVGRPDVPDTIPVHSLLLPMRRRFD